MKPSPYVLVNYIFFQLNSLSKLIFCKIFQLLKFGLKSQWDGTYLDSYFYNTEPG